MVLVIDVGNTNIKYGVFDGETLVGSYRVSSLRNRTADEYGAVLINLLESSGIKKSDIGGVICASVIPALNYTIEHMCTFFFGIKPMYVGKGIKSGLNLKVENPKEVGADRIVSSVAAYNKFGGDPVIVIDFGTATTFNVVNSKGEFLGGAIAPGIKSSLDGLVNNTALLSMIELDHPKESIGKNTVTNMQVGMVYGFAGLVDGIVSRIKDELGEPNIHVVATGGIGEIVANESKQIDELDRMLTLKGLIYLYNRNRK